jgi:hypothetical protein
MEMPTVLAIFGMVGVVLALIANLTMVTRFITRLEGRLDLLNERLATILDRVEKLEDGDNGRAVRPKARPFGG